jgi:hypothetical protein
MKKGATPGKQKLTKKRLYVKKIIQLDGELFFIFKEQGWVYASGQRR